MSNAVSQSPGTGTRDADGAPVWVCSSCGGTFAATVARHRSGLCLDCWRG